MPFILQPRDLQWKGERQFSCVCEASVETELTSWREEMKLLFGLLDHIL